MAPIKILHVREFNKKEPVYEKSIDLIGPLGFASSECSR